MLLNRYLPPQCNKTPNFFVSTQVKYFLLFLFKIELWLKNPINIYRSSSEVARGHLGKKQQIQINLNLKAVQCQLTHAAFHKINSTPRAANFFPGM